MSEELLKLTNNLIIVDFKMFDLVSTVYIISSEQKIVKIQNNVSLMAEDICNLCYKENIFTIKSNNFFKNQIYPLIREYEKQHYSKQKIIMLQE